VRETLGASQSAPGQYLTPEKEQENRQLSTLSIATARSIRLFALLSMPLTIAAAQTATSRIVIAANKFLSTLDDKQRQAVLFSFDDQEQRRRWSNFPVSFVRRGGIDLKDMTDAQRSAAMQLVASALSAKGFEKVQQIMQGDEVLKETDNGGGPGPQGRLGGQRPGNGPPGNGAPRGNGGPPPSHGLDERPPVWNGPTFGKDLYYISILGKPSEEDPWMLQFGGHHLALNITVAGEHGVLTPTLTGAQPALYTVNGKTVRPLGKESDKAFALLQALNENQRKQAILSYRLADLVLGPGQDGKTIVPEGLKASAMNERQRAMLLDVISEWSGIIHESAAAARMAEIKSELDQTWFAWSGPVTVAPGKNITAYYRIQAPHLVIEYAPQELGGDPALHVHTMYRDPTNDYGRRFTTK
jgi:hypothetical protein